jgi:hypothetical protein
MILTSAFLELVASVLKLFELNIQRAEIMIYATSRSVIVNMTQNSKTKKAKMVMWQSGKNSLYDPNQT